MRNNQQILSQHRQGQGRADHLHNPINQPRQLKAVQKRGRRQRPRRQHPHEVMPKQRVLANAVPGVIPPKPSKNPPLRLGLKQVKALVLVQPNSLSRHNARQGLPRNLEQWKRWHQMPRHLLRMSNPMHQRLSVLVGDNPSRRRPTKKSKIDKQLQLNPPHRPPPSHPSQVSEGVASPQRKQKHKQIPKLRILTSAKALLSLYMLRAKRPRRTSARIAGQRRHRHRCNQSQSQNLSSPRNQNQRSHPVLPSLAVEKLARKLNAQQRHQLRRQKNNQNRQMRRPLSRQAGRQEHPAGKPFQSLFIGWLMFLHWVQKTLLSARMKKAITPGMNFLLARRANCPTAVA